MVGLAIGFIAVIRIAKMHILLLHHKGCQLIRGARINRAITEFQTVERDAVECIRIWINVRSGFVIVAQTIQVRHLRCAGGTGQIGENTTVFSQLVHNTQFRRYIRVIICSRGRAE